MYEEIINSINKYDTIVIARHVGGDIDALGSQLALKKIIVSLFPNKHVYAVGSYSSRFKFLGEMDNGQIDYNNSLLILLDTPKISRIDIDNIENLDKFNYKIKIDHHPLEESFCDIEYVDDSSSSTCELIIELCKKMNIDMPISSAELLYMGLVSDTNRFLYPSTGFKTLSYASYLIDKYKINITKLYESMYLRDMAEIRFIGYIFQNLKITKNGVGYIKITDSIQKEYGIDPASAGNMVGELSYINELICWVTFSEDVKQNFVRVSVRSRGPSINTLCMQYNGGGHKLASGIRLPNFDLSDNIINDLDSLCESYLKEIK